MVNKIWTLMILIGIIFSIVTNKIDLINKEILESTKTSLDMIVKILPVMSLWLGIMKIAEKSGLLEKLSKKLSKVLCIIFPEIPKGHVSLSYISSNLICNFFGLGSASTPFGLKAISSLQELNKDKKVASNSMITFLVLNTTGLTLIPTTIIALRMLYKSANPISIVLPCFLATLTATFTGLMLDYLFRRKKHD